MRPSALEANVRDAMDQDDVAERLEEQGRLLEVVMAQGTALSLAFAILTEALTASGIVSSQSLHGHATRVLTAFEEREGTGSALIGQMRDELDHLLGETTHPHLHVAH